MTDRISLPIDGWKLEARKFGDGIEIAIVTDDKVPASHYVRLGSIGSAALRDYLISALSRRCQKCGTETNSEEAWVDGQIWCHPCADQVCPTSEVSRPNGETP